MIHYIYCQPLFNLILLTFVIIVTYSVLNSAFNKLKYILNFPVFLGSIFLLACATIIGREGGNHDVELRPFITFVMAKYQVEYYRTFFMNMLLFVPLGLSMPYALSKKPRKWIVVIPIVFSAVLSAGIEFAQYYYHLGRCETDDVVANTLGAAVGSLSYLLYISILKNRKESLMNNKLGINQNLLINLYAKSLFDNKWELPENFNSDELIEEAMRQTIFPQIFSFIKENAPQDADKLFSKIIAKNIRVEFGHNEVHNALSKSEIPYVIFKGVASAQYYTEPTLRMMGDIDILVLPRDIEKTDKALKSIGFVTKDSLDNDSHIAYHRRDGLICEVHRHINGIPQNAAGEKTNQYFADIFEKSTELKTTNGVCVVPSKFHHGLILLIHTATHITREGIGLRHLGDWSTFVNSFTNEEFIDVFEKPLKEIGLWRFAVLITFCCQKYLSLSKQNWVDDFDDELTDGIVEDILNGGNFGNKDVSRYNHIKYISNRKNGLMAKKSPILQLFVSINEKSKKNFPFSKKSKLLLPIAWIFTVCKYFYLVVIGKRSIDTFSTINKAKQRKDLYSEFKLFEN